MAKSGLPGGGGAVESIRQDVTLVGSALKQLLGREPTRFRDVLAATLPR
jgi:hypothetical protein